MFPLRLIGGRHGEVSNALKRQALANPDSGTGTFQRHACPPRYADEEEVEDRADHEDLVALVERFDEAHTEEPSKTGCGIDGFFRRRNNSEQFSTPSFWVRRTDGTETDFSYIWAVKGIPMGKAQEFSNACRKAVSSELLGAKWAAFEQYGDESGCMPCEITGELVTYEEAHLDHAWPTFAQIVATFRSARGWTAQIPEGVLSVPKDAQTETSFVDESVAEAFRETHRGVAILRIVSSKANLSKAASQRRPAVRRPVKLAG